MATELSRPARLEQLRKRLEEKGLLSEGEGKLLMQMRQIADRLERGGDEISLVTLVNTANVGLVDVTWGDLVFQLDAVKAREVAWMLLEAAAIAEAEAMVMRFMEEAIGADAHVGASMLMHFRRYREAGKSSSLLVKDADKH